MSHRTKVLPVLFGAILSTACGTSPAAPVFDAPAAFEVSAPAGPLATQRGPASRDVPSRPVSDRTPRRDEPTRRPDVDRRPDRVRDQDRIEAAAKAAIEDALQMLARAEELAKRDTRPAIQEALVEARQMISQAIDAYNNKDFSRALVKANNAADVLSMILRVLG